MFFIVVSPLCAQGAQSCYWVGKVTRNKVEGVIFGEIRFYLGLAKGYGFTALPGVWSDKRSCSMRRLTDTAQIIILRRPANNKFWSYGS